MNDEDERTIRLPDPPTGDLKIRPHPNLRDSFTIIRDGYQLVKLDGPTVGQSEHVLDDVRSFANYLNRLCPFESRGMVDILVQDDLRIIATIDPMSPEPHVVKCELDHHPAWIALLNMLGKNTQMAMHQHIRAWRNTIEDSEALLGMFSAIDVVGADRMSSHTDEVGGTRLSATESKKNVSVKIPPVIRHRIACFTGIDLPIEVDGTEERMEASYVVETLVRVDTDPLSFALTWPTIRLVERNARLDVVAMLNSILEDGFLVCMGLSDHTTVSERAL